MKKTLLTAAALIHALPATQALAAKYKIEITNLTNANYFTPILTAAHKKELDMFEVGEPASDPLQAIAEGGDIGPMQPALENGGAATSVAETPGVLGILGDPSGLACTNGSGVSGSDSNPTVHIHRGIIGDDDNLGGASDLDRSSHRWQDPVARVTIIRVRGNYELD